MSNSPEMPDGSVVKECLTPDIVERFRRENSMPPYYGPPKLQEDAAADIARLTEENRPLRIENATLHGWIRQQDEYIKRLTEAARKGK